MDSFLHDIHFSDSASDSVLKLISWLLSFVCIFAIIIKNNSAENLASSYFIFSATVMADLAMHFSTKTNPVARFINSLLFVAFLYVAICAFLGMLEASLPDFIMKSQFFICITFLILLVIDFLWIFTFPLKKLENKSNKDLDYEKEEYIKAFEAKLK